jgi:ABC-type dipeptide/oligopeptide/nickel transport system ATPase component
VSELEARVLRGEHLALYGPRGSGKSSVVTSLMVRLRREHVPCALSATTHSLDDITRALERAYPGVDTGAVSRRTARARLWRAAGVRRGVLLLDHLGEVSNAMIAYLRFLHGGVAGVLSAVDVDSERERQQMKPWRFGAMSVRMPLTSSLRLKSLLQARWTLLGCSPLSAEQERQLVRDARGRPGWIIRCAELAAETRYWSCEHLLVAVLATDTEAAVRHRALELLRPVPVGGEPP